MSKRPASHVLTGTRIRERRLSLGRRQADVARVAGISAAYLNLIEHNRRPVGAALIARLADALNVAAAELESSREEARIAALHEAAARLPDAGTDLQQATEFSARFPGWASALIAANRHNEALERQLIALSERMSQDSYLPAALHEILSAVTSLRATAAILAEGEELPAELAARFHANLDEDGQRLSTTSKALVAYLDSFGNEGSLLTPQEQVEAWLAAGARPLDQSAELSTDAALALAQAHLDRTRAERAALPDATLARAAQGGGDPLAIAAAVKQPVDLVMRRLVDLQPHGFGQAGLIACDGAGVLILRRPTHGFPLSRQGGGCALLPLFHALSQPQTAIRAIVEAPDGACFDTLSLASRSQPLGVDGPVLTHAQMLTLPVARPATGDVIPVGPACRICPRATCPARREPSILTPA